MAFREPEKLLPIVEVYRVTTGSIVVSNVPLGQSSADRRRRRRVQPLLAEQSVHLRGMMS